MTRRVSAIAAIVLAMGAAACSTRGTDHRASGHGDKGIWTIASCQVDVNYTDDANAVDHYVPDTDSNFQDHYADNSIVGAATMAVVITFVNNTGGPASLPTDLEVSFTDRSGNHVGNPQIVNNVNGAGYGPAVANGHGSGETFSSGTIFSQGETVAESPDLGVTVPQQPDLKCQVSRQ